MSDPVVIEFMKSIKQDVRDLTAAVNAMNEKADKRLDDLEDSQSQIKGAAKVVIAIATVLSGIVSWIIAHVWKV